MAGSAIVGTLRAILTADTGEFDAAMKRVSSAANGMAKDLTSVGKQATALGTSLTKTLTLPLVALGAGAAKLAIDFESSFAGVGKTVDGVMDNSGRLTDAGREMAQSFRDMAKEIPVNVNELNKIGEAAGALGIRKEDIAEFTKTMALLGVTTNLTSEQAATSIAQIQNIFNAAGKETKNFASALVALGNDGASTEAQIVDFASRLSGAGHQIGLSQQAVLGFSAALANVGLNAELGGTALSKVMSAISVAVDTGGEKLKAFAKTADLSSEAFAKLFKADAETALAKYIQGLGKAGDAGENLTIILREMGLKGANVQDVMKRLAGAGDQVTTALDLSNKAWRENTALTDEATKRFATTQAQLTLLWNRITDVGITIGNALLPVIQSLVGWVGSLIPVIESAARWFTDLPAPLQLSAIGLLAVVAAAGPALIILGQLLTAAGTVSAAFAAKGIATRILAGNVAGLSAGLGILTKAVSVVAVAFAGWSIGKWIGETTGLTDKIEWLTGRLMGLTDAEIAAGMAARKQSEAMAAQTKTADALGDTEKIVTQVTKAMSAATVSLGKATAQTTEEKKDADKASKVLEKQIEKERDRFRELADQVDRDRASLKALGVVTERDVIAQMDALGKVLDTAKEEGLDFRLVVQALLPKLIDLQNDAKASGVEVRELGNAIVFARAVSLQLAPAIGPQLFVPFNEAVVKAIYGMKTVSEGFLTAQRDAFVLEDAYKALGITTDKSLVDALKKAEKAYADLKASGKATHRELEQGAEAVAEATARMTDTGNWQKFSAGLKVAEVGLNALAQTATGGQRQVIAALSSGISIMQAYAAAAGTAGAAATAAWGAATLGISIAATALVNWWQSAKAAAKAVKEEADQLIDSLIKLGQLPKISAIIDGNVAASSLPALRAQLAGLTDAQDQLNAAIEKYGFSIEELGPKWKQQRLTEQAQDLIKEFTVLTASGIDWHVVLDKMGPALKEFLDKVKLAGGELPASMKPMIAKMIEMGQLFDENGNLITDMTDSGFTFAETMAEGFDRVIVKLQELIETLTKGVGNAIGGLPHLPSWMSGGFDWNQAGQGPGVPKMARGGVVMQPTLAMIGEAGPEAVIPLGGLSGGRFGGNVTIIQEQDGRVAARYLVPFISGEVKRLQLTR